METVFVASDHAGFDLKQKLKWRFASQFKFDDLGVFVPEPVDYPAIAASLAGKVSRANGNKKGILICGTGIGMSIVANKFPKVRAALIYDDLSARMAREHNDANVACIGARTMNEMLAVRLIDVFLSSKFIGLERGQERHKNRVDQIIKIEKQNLKQKKKT